MARFDTRVSISSGEPLDIIDLIEEADSTLLDRVSLKDVRLISMATTVASAREASLSIVEGLAKDAHADWTHLIEESQRIQEESQRLMEEDQQTCCTGQVCTGHAP